jgi:hypothetical protein
LQHRRPAGYQPSNTQQIHTRLLVNLVRNLFAAAQHTFPSSNAALHAVLRDCRSNALTRKQNVHAPCRIVPSAEDDPFWLPARRGLCGPLQALIATAPEVLLDITVLSFKQTPDPTLRIFVPNYQEVSNASSPTVSALAGRPYGISRCYCDEQLLRLRHRVHKRVALVLGCSSALAGPTFDGWMDGWIG